jgi:hypothetical protein
MYSESTATSGGADVVSRKAAMQGVDTLFILFPIPKEIKCVAKNHYFLIYQL